MLYCISLALSVSRLVFCFLLFFLSLFFVVFLSLFFVFFVAPYWFAFADSLFPKKNDIDGCATTAISLVSGWVFYFVTTGWIF